MTSAAAEFSAPNLGAEIRHLRRVRKMTLAQLAENIGKSVGYLSEVERGNVRPSIGSLQDVSEALGVKIGWFFHSSSPPQTSESNVVVRANNRRRLAYSNLSDTDYLGMTDHLLSAGLGGKLAMIMTRYTPGASSGDELASHDGEESGFVQSGTLELQIEDETYRLNAGDSYSFDSQRPHRYRNPGNIDTVVIFAITPVTLHY
ncbi:MAG: cupin domain-containing protein [Pseudomonadota bacterium]